MFLKHLRITIISLILFTILTGMIYPSGCHRYLAADLPGKGEWKPDKKRREGPRLRTYRSAFFRSEVLLEPALGDWPVRL
jgi:hypothetical protein